MAHEFMSDHRNNWARKRGRWLLFCEVLAVGFLLYFIHTHDAFVALQQPLLGSDQRISTSNSLTTSTTDLEPHARTKSKSKILNSEWIKLFPNLKHLTIKMKGNSSHTMITSPNNTKISLIKDTYKVGGTLRANIIARDDAGNNKVHGGDFFLVILRRPESEEDGVLCEVLDVMDGSYNVTCILPWAGRALLRVILVHPSESIYQIMNRYSSEDEYGVTMNTTLLNSKNQTEYTACSMGFPGKSSQELCDYSNPSHGEKRMCLKPPSGVCSRIIWQDKIVDSKKLKLWDKVYFRVGVNFKTPVKGSDVAVYVSQSKRPLGFFDKDLFNGAQNAMAPSGWFLNSKWTSIKKKDTAFDQSKLEACARNKDLYFIGDSTIRQYYSFFIKALKVRDSGPDNSIAWSQKRDAVSKNLKSSFHYRAHGPPLHNPGPEDSRPYISNTLDLITKGGKGTIIIITLGYHFELYDPDVFGRRISIVKKSVITLLSRLPGAKVIIKGLHYHGYSPLCPSPWTAYRYEIMLRHEFSNVKGVTFFETWDLSVLANNELLHPTEKTLTNLIGLLLSYFC